jgi:hypothetical protein
LSVAASSLTLRSGPQDRIITLSVSLLLTTGDSIPKPIHEQIGFCKK